MTTAALRRPPPVIVTGGDRRLELDAWTMCWTFERESFCADGAPPDRLEVIEADQIVVEFPVTGWDFFAETTHLDVECGRRQLEPIEPSGDTTFGLVPQGPAGRYDVTLIGRGPQGDVFVSFEWHTTVDGIVPTPAARMYVLRDDDGRPQALTPDLWFEGLSATPSTAAAVVTLTGPDGTRASTELATEPGCFDGDGSLRLVGIEGETPLEIVAAEGEPIRVTVRATLDGRAHIATAVWPDDVDPECAPCLVLVFDPPLPRLGDDEPSG